MSNRGDVTRNLIKQQARRLFAAHGFSGVTMQDICEACDLSRGGLYRHYVSTGEIFGAILSDDEAEALESLQRATENGTSASAMLRRFLRNRIRAVTDPERSIENAAAEFCAKDSKGSYFLRRRAETSIKILTDMIKRGISEGDFSCENPGAVAKHLLWLIEGMAKHSLLMPVSQEEIETQVSLAQTLFLN